MEPVVFQLPVSVAFLYFVTYSVLGWCMETVYCSVRERRLVPRGFLYGPVCPIYGVGALLMICCFQPLMGNPVLFYVVATMCMSAWEYFVGWLLETATHVKYWDYSDRRYNLKGRICLQMCLMWGVLSFLVLYFIHPMIAQLLLGIPGEIRYFIDGIFFGVFSLDTGATIYQLAKTTQLLAKLQQAGDELRLQAHLGKAELADRLALSREGAPVHLEDLLPDSLDERGRMLKARYDALIARTEQLSRRFRRTYRNMSVFARDSAAFESVKRRGEQVKDILTEMRKGKRDRR